MSIASSPEAGFPSTAPDGSRGRANFFLAVKPLSRAVPPPVPRTPASRLRREGPRFSDELAPRRSVTFAAHLAAVRRIDWVVHAKKPFGGPERVLAYLGRYTHRVAIANSRVQAWTTPGRVHLEGLSPTTAALKTMSWKLTSSSAASCSTSCPTASIASVTRLLRQRPSNGKAGPLSLAHAKPGRADGARKGRTGVARTGRTGSPSILHPAPECGGAMSFVAAHSPWRRMASGPRRRRFGAILHERRLSSRR